MSFEPFVWRSEAANAPLGRYFMAVTDGRDTCSEMNTYILESESLTGEWKLVTYMRSFGEQAFFVNFPTKFISPDGRKMIMCYSANFAPQANGHALCSNPPESSPGMMMAEIKLLER